MNNFEDIQDSWLSQPVNQPVRFLDQQALQSKWQQRQRKLFKNNLGITIGFAAAMIGIGWIYFSFRDRYGWAFDVSIAIVYLLMLVFLGVTWKSYAFRKESFENSSIGFIDYQVNKLKWQRVTLTRYVWVYNLLLWMAICLYTLEITKNGSVWFTVGAIAATTAYIGGISIWVRFFKQKKQLKAIDEMLEELRLIKESITG